MTRQPTRALERELWGRSYERIAGVDEAGRGAWAGPVVAAAVILPPRPDLEDLLAPVRDSKLLTPHRRDVCYDLIAAHAIAYSVGCASSVEIDRLGIVPATRLAMARAIGGLRPQADYLILDAVRLDDVPLPQTATPRADEEHLCVSAASIVAKVARDRWMAALGAALGGYGFERHKGYGTAAHLGALQALGPACYHRRSFAPIRALLAEPQGSGGATSHDRPGRTG